MYYIGIILIHIAIHGNRIEGSLNDDVKNFLEKFDMLTENSLFDKKMQAYYNISSLVKPINIFEKSAEVLNKFADSVKANTDVANNLLGNIKNAIESDYHSYPEGEKRSLTNCFGYNGDLRWNPIFQSNVSLNDICELGPTNCLLPQQTESTAQMHVLNKEQILHSFRSNSNNNGRTRHIFYGADDGYYVQYPAENKENNKDCGNGFYDGKGDFDARLRPWYVGTMTPKDGKDVVIAVDVSKGMASSVLQEQMKIVVETLLKTVDVKDRIMVALFFGANPSYPVANCLNGKLTAASPAIKHEIKLFLEEKFNMPFTGGLKYSTVFSTAYLILRGNQIENQTNRLKVIHFITAGSRADLSDEVNAELEGRAKEQNCSVILNIFRLTEDGIAPGDEDNTVIENACKCGWCSPEVNQNNYVVVRKDDNFQTIKNTVIETVYASMKKEETENHIRYTLPHAPVTGLGAMIDACIRIRHNNKTKGILCVTFYNKVLFDLVPLQLESTEDSYVFVVGTNGICYIHPKLAKVVFESDQAIPLNILHLETSYEFQKMYNNMISGVSGNITTNVTISVSKGDKAAKWKNKRYTYTWRKVEGSPFIVCVVISSQYQEFILDSNQLQSKTTEKYHRLDLYGATEKLCLIRNQVATNESSVFKLTYKVFKKPLTYFKDETLESTLELVEYFENKSEIAPNNMFATADVPINLQKTVLETSGVVNCWLNDNSTDSAYILFRYMAMSDGTLRVYPGLYLHPYYDPRVRSWYQLTTSTDGLYVVIPPYVDGWSNTTLVSLVKTIYRNGDYGKQVAGTIGFDLSIGYIQSMIFSTMPDCHDGSNFQCILLSQLGYIIFHNAFLKKIDDVRRDYHITEMEPETAADLIKKGYLSKDYCIGYHKTVKSIDENYREHPPVAHLSWFYTFAQLTEVVVGNLNSDGSCPYELASIESTNMLLLRIKKICSFEETKRKKCECSTDEMKTCVQSGSIDDLKGICECPCYQYIPCIGDLPSLNTSLICSPPEELSQLKDLYTTDWYPFKNKSKLGNCIQPRCGTSKSSIECNRLDCKWCFQYGNGTDLPDKERFCTDEKKECFPVKYPPTPNPKDESSDELEIIIPIVVVIIIVIIICASLLYTRKKKQLRTTNDSNNEIPEKQQTQITNSTFYQEIEQEQSQEF